MKIKTKIAIPLIIILIVLVVFIIKSFSVSSGHGSFTSSKSIEYNTKNSMIMYYSSFNGNKYNLINLKKNDTITLNISVNTKNGRLKVSLINPNNNVLFTTENPKANISKTININKNGNYKIQVEGKHSGSFHIRWHISTTKL